MKRRCQVVTVGAHTMRVQLPRGVVLTDEAIEALEEIARAAFEQMDLELRQRPPRKPPVIVVAATVAQGKEWAASGGYRGRAVLFATPLTVRHGRLRGIVAERVHFTAGWRTGKWTPELLERLSEDLELSGAKARAGTP